MSEPSGPVDDFSEFDEIDEFGNPNLRSITIDDSGEVAFTVGYHHLDELDDEAAAALPDDEAAAALLDDGPVHDLEELVRPVTGDERVDAAVAELDALDELPTAAHADVFEEVHRRLQGALADLDVG
jgi:hypothetical protein